MNEIGDLERMARLGVDGLCGNYPDRIRVAIATRVEEVLADLSVRGSGSAPVAPPAELRLAPSRPLPAGLGDLPLQPGDLLLQIIQPQQEGVHPARLRLPAPLAAMDQQAQVARGVVLLAAVTQQLDLQLALVERGLGLLAELRELLVQAVEQRGPGHVVPPWWLAGP